MSLRAIRAATAWLWKAAAWRWLGCSSMTWQISNPFTSAEKPWKWNQTHNRRADTAIVPMQAGSYQPASVID